MMKSGFVLIELIVATLIASILSSMLLTSLFQSTRVQTSIDNTISIAERIAIITNQLEKDLAGAFVPTQSEQKKEVSNKQTVETDDKKNDTGKKNAEKNDTTDQTPQKKEKKPIEKIFFSTNKNGMLDTLTFVTNNPLIVFVDKEVGMLKPKAVRVQYTLKTDPENKNSYILLRQESNELDLAEYKNVRAYEIIGGIKKLTITFTARLEKKSASAQATADTSSPAKPTTNAKAEKKEYEYKTQSEWVSEQEDKNKESEKKESEFPRIPYSVEFKIILWDKTNKKEQEFTVVCSIPVDSVEAQQDRKKESSTPKKEQSKPENNNNKPDQQNKSTQITEVVVYNNEIEVLNNALNSLKKLLGHS